MGLVKKILKYLGVVLLIPILYISIALLCSYIPVIPKAIDTEKNHRVYLASNGIHLEIIIPKNQINPILLKGLEQNHQEHFLSFGWGDKTYYTKAATSLDFNTVNRYQAVFINTPALIHVTRYVSIQNHWIEIKMTSSQLMKLQTYINNSFKNNQEYKKIILPKLSYNSNDNFYEANGKYNCFNTCNTWVNTAFKKSDTKACLWTPFDFGLLRIHKK